MARATKIERVKEISFTVPASDRDTFVVITIEQLRIDPATGRFELNTEWLGDRLVPPDKFSWAGKSVFLRPIEYKLLDAIFNTTEKRIDLRTAVKEGVWPVKPKPKTASTTCTRINEKLMECNFTHAVLRFKDGWIILE